MNSLFEDGLGLDVGESHEPRNWSAGEDEGAPADDDLEVALGIEGPDFVQARRTEAFLVAVFEASPPVR